MSEKEVGKQQVGIRVWTDIGQYGTTRFHATAISPGELPYAADEEQRTLLTDSDIEAIEKKAFEAGRKGHGSQLDDTGMYGAFEFTYDDFEDYKKSEGKK